MHAMASCSIYELQMRKADFNLCKRRLSFAIQLSVARQLVSLFRLMREDGDESPFLSA